MPRQRTQAKPGFPPFKVQCAILKLGTVLWAEKGVPLQAGQSSFNRSSWIIDAPKSLIHIDLYQPVAIIPQRQIYFTFKC